MPVRAVVFDVNETLFSLAPVRARFDRTGLGAETVALWFATVLRDGFALAAADGFATFPDIARFHLRRLAAGHGFEDTDRVADEVIEGFREVEAHDDVVAGLEALHAAGLTLATFTNGTAEITRGFLERTGIEEIVEHVLDVSGPRRWKPDPVAYRWACDAIGVDPRDAAMVAVHPWDVHGAQQVGMTGCFLARDDEAWPEMMGRPDVTVPRLTALVDALT